MTISKIATATSSARPNVRHRVRLDGRDYLLLFDWSGREGAWYVHILDASGSPIVTGRKVVAGGKLGHRSIDPRRPAGLLMAIDPSGIGDPGIEDLGRRVFITYASADELLIATSSTGGAGAGAPAFEFGGPQ